jgi:putative peptidoglycan lipid II flippase
MAISCPFYLCSALMNYVSMAHNDFKPMSMRNPVQNVGMLIGVFLSYYSNKLSS